MLRVNGDVKGRLKAYTGLTDAIIGQSLLADVDVVNGSITSLFASVAIGDPAGSPISVSAGADIVQVSALSINADISAVGRVQYVLTTGQSGGHFKGSLTAAALDIANTGFGNGIIVFYGDLYASISVAGDLKVPLYSNVGKPEGEINVGGDVRASITFNSNCFTPISIDGDLYSFFYIQREAVAPITISGTIQQGGELRIGAVNTSALYTDISVGAVDGGAIDIRNSGASFYGTIDIAGDLNGALDLHGPVYGFSDIAGHERLRPQRRN